MAGCPKGIKQHRQTTYEKMKEYGKKFKQARESIALNAKQMSEEIGVSVWTLLRWERGKCIPQTNIRYLEIKIDNIVKKYKEKVII